MLVRGSGFGCKLIIINSFSLEVIGDTQIPEILLIPGGAARIFGFLKFREFGFIITQIPEVLLIPGDAARILGF